MSEKPTSIKISKTKVWKRTPDHGLSKNHSKSVQYRLRVQQSKEAIDEIKHYADDPKRIS